MIYALVFITIVAFAFGVTIVYMAAAHRLECDSMQRYIDDLEKAISKINHDEIDYIEIQQYKDADGNITKHVNEINFTKENNEII